MLNEFFPGLYDAKTQRLRDRSIIRVKSGH